MKRYGRDPKALKRSSDATFLAPLKCDRYGVLKWQDGDRVFVCSWSDFFHKDADEWRSEAWNIIRQRPELIFLIPTKRPERLQRCLPVDWGDGWPNVWLGVSVENQKRAEERLPILLEVPAVIHFASCEPLLSQLDLSDYLWGPRHLDWVIAGCESKTYTTPGRPAQIEWFRLLRDDCLGAGIPYFLKQMAANGKVIHMPELEGHVWKEIP